MASTAANAALEVHLGCKAILTNRIIIIEGESLPPEPMNVPSGDHVPDPPIDKDKERRKKKVAIMKKARKVRLDEPNQGSSKVQGQTHSITRISFRI
ncbi:hypothetical protein COCNU_scaffold003424G000010 [Cocos nucifera]|nr:hypothetical protein [Cocos nucifera]